MIQLSGAGKRFGPKVLFENLDWLVTPQDRAGLVGANGTGKSTLLKILGGLETLDYGSITCAKAVTFGYLPQDGLTLTGNTVFAECLSVFGDLLEMEHELERLMHRMAELDPTGPEYAVNSERFHALDSEFRAREGYAIESQVGMVLAGLGFSKADWHRRVEEFSGGWQMRIALAKLLLQKPNLLLLDEPTNHLDLEARNWLEGYLGSYPHAYVLISHDRYFLDTTVTRIAEIWNKQVYFYSGNYDKYLAQKAQRREQLESAYRNQQEKVRQLETFINRFRYQATKAKQVQSRIKELERIERIEIPPEEKAIHFSFPQPQASGRLVAEFRGVAKSYDSKQVFSDVNFTIERGERIALVGVNGAGKSTLIKLLSGAEPLSDGEYRLGHNVVPDYFAQDQYREFDGDARLIDDLTGVAPRATQTELRTLLGCFLFSDDDVFKHIGVLSGGERSRYALARMLLRPSNFLLLDEPTNHLDMRAKDVLLTALEEFTGTLVFVSHDRYFIDKLATRVFEIGDGNVHVYPGHYEDYLWRKQAASAVSGGAPGDPISATTSIAPTPANGGSAAPVPESSRPMKRLNPIKLQQLKDRLQSIEEDVSRLEAGIAECESALMAFRSADETARVSKLLASRRAELESVLAEWEDLLETIASHECA
jgi:ATP-binding cassette subfamily F protein 3